MIQINDALIPFTCVICKKEFQEDEFMGCKLTNGKIGFCHKDCEKKEK